MRCIESPRAAKKLRKGAIVCRLGSLPRQSLDLPCHRGSPSRLRADSPAGLRHGHPLLRLPRHQEFAKGDERHLTPELRSKVKEVLQRLKRGDSPADLRAADYRIRRLTGNRKGAHTIATSDRWRIVFRFENGNAYDVEVVDYHKS